MIAGSAFTAVPTPLPQSSTHRAHRPAADLHATDEARNRVATA
jgi:hypothetical protein